MRNWSSALPIVFMENTDLAKKLNLYATIASVAVLGLVAGMRQIPRLDLGIDFSFLPAVYSTMNALAAVCLVRSLLLIRQKRVKEHQQMNILALSLSALFLLMYVLYHITTPETKYCGEGAIRPVYYLLLITHVVLAAVSFPFILFTFIRGYTNQIEKHRKMARWVYWVWLYVAISGPIVYLMLRPCMG
jgi:putative membrane protein